MDLMTSVTDVVKFLEKDYPIYNRGVSKTKVYKAVGKKVYVSWKAKAKVADLSARSNNLWDIVCVEMSLHSNIQNWYNKVGMSTSCSRDTNPGYISYEICFREKD